MGNVKVIAPSFPSVPTEVTVANSNGDYFSIKDAIDSITDASSAKPYQVTVYPGLFTENPITCKEYVYLQMSDGAFVQPSDNLSPLFILANNMVVNGGRIIGPTGSLAFLANSTMTNTAVQNLFVLSGQVGISVISPAFLTARDVHITASLYGFHVSGSAATLINISVQDYSTDTSFYASFGGQMYIYNALSSNPVNGIFAKNVATEINVSSVHVFGATNSVRVAQGGNIHGNDVESHDALVYDILQEDRPSSIRLWGSLIKRTRLSIANWDNINCSFSDDTGGDIGTIFTQQIEVGSASLGKESVFGGGDSYTRGMLVYTRNASGTFVDVSTEASSVSGSTFAFPGTGINNSLYVASSLLNADGTDVLTHHGLKVSPTIPAILGSGEIVGEYYSTGVWIEFNHMSSASDTPYLPYAKQVFQRVQSEQTRYDYAIQSLLTKSDEPSLGTNYYWIRWRIKMAISQVPTIQQFKLHTSRTEINADGYVEFFGNARTCVSIPGFSLNNFDRSLAPTPGNEDVFIGDAGGTRIGYGLNRNQFANNAVNSIARAEHLPSELDTSSGIRIKWKYFLKTDSGASENVRFQIVYGWTRDGSGIANTSSDTGNTTLSTTTNDVTVNSQVADEIITDEIMLDVSDVVAMRPDSEGDVLWIQFQRDGSADSYGGAVVLFEISAYFTQRVIGSYFNV